MRGSHAAPGYAPTLSATAIACAGILAFYFADVGDPDLFWHLKAGEWIVAHRALPATDPFLLTQGATPWVLHEWLFEVLVYGADRAAGFVGVRGIVGLFQTATLVILWRALRRGLPDFAALLLTLVCAAAILPYASPRPHLVTLLLVAAFTAVLARHLADPRPARLAALPLLMVLWANMHGGYVVGLALVLLVGTSIWLQAPTDAAPGAIRARGVFLCLVACVLAAAVNPYGFGHFLFPLRVLTMWMGPLIDEWAPLTLKSPAFGAFLVSLGVFVLAQIYRVTPPGPSDLVAPGAMTMLAISAGRHAPLATMVLAVFAVPALRGGAVTRFSRAWGERVRRRGARPGAPQASRDLGGAEYVLNALVLAAAIGFAWVSLPMQHERRMAQANATIGWRAVDVLARAGFEGRCLNAYGFGGYFTYRLWPGSKAFIDGRPDMYPDAFARDYVRMASAAEGWRELFDAQRFDCVVIPRALPLRQLIVERGGFDEVYADADNVLLVRADFPGLPRLREAAGRP